MIEKANVWTDLKLRTSTIALSVLLVMLLACNCVFSEDFRDIAIRVLLMIFGACLGWILGVFASPYSETEAQRFSAIFKVAGTFASGYLLAKADSLFTDVLSPKFLMNLDVGLRVISIVSSMIIFFLFTFIFRNYAPNTRLPTNPTDRNVS
jgi:predicted membrane protein